MDSLFRIAEVAARYQLSLRALRFYEDRGLITPTRVGSARLYSAADCVRIELILKGKKLGFTLSEIEQLLTPRIVETVETTDVTTFLARDAIRSQLQSLEKRRAEVDAAIEELHVALNPEERALQAAG